jgi:hypothetical protein
VIAAFLYTHGNEWEIAQHIEQMQPKGVLLRNAHPKAAEKRVRFIGEGPQIMGCYPGDPSGNEQQKAAHANLEWLNQHKPLVVFDIHQAVTEGANYTIVGEHAAKSAIAGGIMLDRKKIIVSGGTFFHAVPNGSAIETSIKDISPESAAKALVKGLESIASDPEALENQFEELIKDPEVAYYQDKEIPAFLNGSKAPWLEELEEIPSGPAFADLQLMNALRNHLQIPTDVPLYYNCWQHDNYSKEDPQLLGYTREGKVRRQWFGNVVWEIAPPVSTQNGMVQFEKDTSSLSKKAPGLLKIKG